MSKTRSRNDRGTRCVERMRTRGQGRCVACSEPIVPGEAYRELVQADGGFVRRTAHVHCVDGIAAWDAFSLCEADETLAEVRRQHGHRFRVGARVRWHGLEGRIVGGDGGWALVDVCGVVRQAAPEALEWVESAPGAVG